MKKKSLVSICIGLLLALVIIIPLLLIGSGGSYNSIERYKEGVKLIIRFHETEGVKGSGSAFVINSGGGLVTNAHVVGTIKETEGRKIYEYPTKLDVLYVVYEKQLQNKKVVVMQRAEVEHVDPSRDLAYLRVNTPDRAYFKPLALAKRSEAGQHVMAFGYPALLMKEGGKLSKLFENFVVTYIKNNHQSFPDRVELPWDTDMRDLLDVTMFQGSIAKVNDSETMGTGIGEDSRFRGITHSASVQGGMSGGPLVNEKGYVVGVNYGSYKASESYNCAMDSSELIHFLTRAQSDISEIAIVEKNPDSFVYTIRAHMANMSAPQIVLVAVVGVFVIGSLVVIFVLLLKSGKKKNKYASRPISAPVVPAGPQNGPMGGGVSASAIPEGVTRPFDGGADAPTIPLGPSKSSKSPSLVFTGSDSEGRALKFRVSLADLQRERSILIGRSSATCKIHVANKAVSRQQARLMYEEDMQGNVYLFIKDEQARNTTCLNGVPLRDKCLLMPGDEISFADVTMKFSTEMA